MAAAFPKASEHHTVNSMQSSGDLKSDDFMRLNQNKDFKKIYEVARQSPSIKHSISEDLIRLFFDDDYYRANYMVKKINTYFRGKMVFELTPKTGDNPLTYVITLFFKKENGEDGIQFRHRKTMPEFSEPSGLTNGRQICYFNSAIQFICFYLSRGALIDEAENHLSESQCQLLAAEAAYRSYEESCPVKTINKGDFKYEARDSITVISSELSKAKLKRLNYKGFTCEFWHDNNKYNLSISKDEFRPYVQFISDLKTLTHTLTRATGDETKTRADLRQFLNSCYSLIEKQKSGSDFLSADTSGSAGCTYSLMPFKSSMDVIKEIFELLSSSCSSQFDAQHTVAISPDGKKPQSCMGFVFPTLREGKIAGDAGKLESYTFQNMIKQQFRDSPFSDKSDAEVSRIVCENTPVQMIFDIDPLTHRGDAIPDNLDISATGLSRPCSVTAAALYNLAKDQFKIQIPICHDSKNLNNITMITYKVNQIICNSGAHFSLLRITDEGLVYHINDKTVNKITVKPDEKNGAVKTKQLKYFTKYCHSRRLVPYQLSLQLLQ